MKNKDYIYIGCFVEQKQLLDKVTEKNRLSRIIQYPHVTFCYEPAEVDKSLFGKIVKIKAIGYGNDGKNEGLLVEVYSDNLQISKMAECIVTPHITVSVAENEKAVNTRFLEFTKMEPFELEGIFGGYKKDGTLQLSNL